MNRWTIHNFDLVDSTSALDATFVKGALAANSPVDGHVFLARTQSAGRGQYDRTFTSPPGGLYVTIVREPVAQALRAPLPLLVGLATARALMTGQEPIKDVQIRWPNDLLIGHRKIAGILCQALAIGPRWIALVGLGLKLTSNPAALPKNATTLLAADGRQRVPNLMLPKILEQLAQILAAPGDWIAAFAHLDALRGRYVSATVDGRCFQGTADGLTPTGALVLATDSGRQEVARGSLAEIDGQSLRETPSEQLPTT